MNIESETFEKSERLCSIKVISDLFENGNVFHISLFKVLWGISPAKIPFPAQVAFSVPKRGFRSAVVRNLIKRRMREVYRKKKKLLYNHLLAENIQLVIFIIMKGDKIPDYKTVDTSMDEVLRKLIKLTSKEHYIC